MRPPTLIALLLLSSTAALAEGPLTDAAVNAISARFATTLTCDPKSKDLDRGWCPVAHLAQAKYLPVKAPNSALGLSMELPDEGELRRLLLDTTSLSALHLARGTARVTSLKPSSEQEKADLLPVLYDVALALKGMGQSVSVTRDLNAFLSTERAKAGYPLKAAGKSMEYAGKLPARLYQLKNAFVVIESAPSGYFVSVFPAVPLKVK